MKAEASVKALKVEKESEKPEPIQMPPSFKDSIFAKVITGVFFISYFISLFFIVVHV